MALNINVDRSRLNDSLRQLASFFMQNKLSELSNERYFDRSMGVMSEQDRLMRERAAAEDTRSRALKKYESGINVDEYIKKAFIDTAKSNDAFDYNVKAGQVAKEAGDLAKAKQHYGAAYEMAIPQLTARMNALKGKVDEKDFLATMEAFGEDGIEKIMSEAGTNARFGADLPIKQQQAATSAYSAQTDRGKLGLEADKFKAEQGGPGGMGDKQKKEYIDAIDKATSFLVDQGVKGEAMNSGIRALFDSGKVYDPMSRENRGKALTYAQEIKMNIIQGVPPTKPQLSFLTKIWNVPAVEAGGLPSPQTGLNTTETVDAEAKINDNMLAMITNQIMQRLQLGEDKRDYATQLAREFLAGIK